MLESDQKDEAIRFLTELSERQAEPTSLDKPGGKSSKKPGSFSVNDYLSATIGTEKPIPKNEQPLEMQLRAVQFSERVDADSDFDLIEYWKEKSSAFPAVWPLARVVLAIAATQCSIERDFNLFNGILVKARSHLAGQTVKRILIIRTNPELIAKAVKALYPDE
ncbi:predicted protein [Culex quinquefasciatus]|uniref:Predicted protein n=1 Tax=Culex quinquefasciatus TaxID=7176 RepID=B0XEF6_CULQU|nr:predicted protein [Culex quinquefasciatus]|eukprot:XP_001868028.1 predicted protein [Culex quinquefasciatus]